MENIILKMYLLIIDYAQQMENIEKELTHLINRCQADSYNKQMKQII